VAKIKGSTVSHAANKASYPSVSEQLHLHFISQQVGISMYYIY